MYVTVHHRLLLDESGKYKIVYMQCFHVAMTYLKTICQQHFSSCATVEVCELFVAVLVDIIMVAQNKMTQRMASPVRSSTKRRRRKLILFFFSSA